jgi:hypothetical protein
MRRLVLTLLVSGLLVTQASGQGLPVFDATQVAQNVVSLANDALNLLPLPVIDILADISSDIATLNTIIQQGTQIGLDVSSLQTQLNTLFDLSTAPVTSSALAVRIQQIHTLIWQARAYAMRVNTLVQTLQNTLRHIDALSNTIATLAGNKQNLQVLNQKAATLNYIQVVEATGQAANWHSEQYEQQKQLLIQESWRLIKQNVMAGY